MKQLLEFIPLILFFVVYKLSGVRDAAITLVIATLIQMLILKWKYGKIEKQQIIMSSAVVFFGVLTAYFNDIKYLQWKVTLVNALFALVLLIGQFGFKTCLIQKLLGKELQLPNSVWQRLNLGWAIFFIICMMTNIYISEYFAQYWAEFKSFGLLAMTFIATIITGIYIYRYLPQNKE